MITIELPWPDKRLSPNSRCHWAKKHQAAAQAHEDAKILTYSARMEKHNQGSEFVTIFGDYEAHYIFQPPDRRRRDIDNIHSSCKNYQDGVCAALGIDDSRIKRTVLEWGEVVKGGKVVLRLEEMK